MNVRAPRIFILVTILLSACQSSSTPPTQIFASELRLDNPATVLSPLSGVWGGEFSCPADHSGTLLLGVRSLGPDGFYVYGHNRTVELGGRVDVLAFFGGLTVDTDRRAVFDLVFPRTEPTQKSRIEGRFDDAFRSFSGQTPSGCRFSMAKEADERAGDRPKICKSTDNDLDWEIRVRKDSPIC